MRGIHPRRCWTLPAAVITVLSGSAAAKAEKVTVHYDVKKGDTLTGISNRFGVTIDEILDWNDDLEQQAVEKSDQGGNTLQEASFKLRPGMTLRIPGKPSGKSKVVTYEVESGDSLWAIGKKFHVKPTVILKWNSDKLGGDGGGGGHGKGVDVDAAAQQLRPGMVLAVPGKPSGSGKKVIKYKVKSGDSLWAIGKKFHVKPKVLVKWNPKDLGGGSGGQGKSSSVDPDSLPLLQAGMKLVIHAVRPDLGERIAVLRVKKGHTPKKVADRYDVGLSDLLSHNFLLAKDTLSVGDLLEVPLSVTSKDTRSVGSPHAGKLVAGEKMPPGPGYIIKQPQLAYGTSELITGVIQCVAHVQRSFEDTPDLVMGHLSRKGGGKLFPHKSHQSGRDIDIGYYHRKLSPHNFVKATHANLDVRRTASFLECLVDSGDVKYVFINTYIQKVLYHHFKKRKFTAEFLTTVFQYPHEGGKQLGIVRHEKGHDDHMHVRFFCPEGDSACHN